MNVSSIHSHIVIRNSLSPRKSTDTILWCPKEAQPYVIFTPQQLMPRGSSFVELLLQIYNYIVATIASSGNSLIEDGHFMSVAEDGTVLYVEDPGSEQLTWERFGFGLSALLDWMNKNGYRSVNFSIRDGYREVGIGYIH